MLKRKSTFFFSCELLPSTQQVDNYTVALELTLDIVQEVFLLRSPRELVAGMLEVCDFLLAKQPRNEAIDPTTIDAEPLPIVEPKVERVHKLSLRRLPQESLTSREAVHEHTRPWEEVRSPVLRRRQQPDLKPFVKLSMPARRPEQEERYEDEMRLRLRQNEKKLVKPSVKKMQRPVNQSFTFSYRGEAMKLNPERGVVWQKVEPKVASIGTAEILNSPVRARFVRIKLGNEEEPNTVRTDHSLPLLGNFILKL